MLKILFISNSCLLLLGFFLFGCSSQSKLINSPKQIQGLYRQASPQAVKIDGSFAQLVESKFYSYTYDQVYEATILSLSYNKYSILIDNYEEGFISGKNDFCTFAIYLEGADEKKVKMTIIYDIYTDFENKEDLIRKDIENQFLSVYRFL